MPYLQNAAFGRSVDIICNFDLLNQYSINRYKIQVAKWPGRQTRPSESDYRDLSDFWGNYRWNPGTGDFDYIVVGPDSQGKYKVPAKNEVWATANLALRWDTRRFADGKYSLRTKLWYSNGLAVAIPKSVPNELTLVVDNSHPTAIIGGVEYLGNSIETCGILSLQHAGNPIDFNVTAFDDDGHIRGISLIAHYGNNQSFTIFAAAYDPVLNGLHWNGLMNETVSHLNWPQSCAYQFRLSATGRVTDGYSYIQDAAFNKHITVLVP